MSTAEQKQYNNLKKAWQISLSCQKPSGSGIAHWFLVSSRTDKLVESACGFRVNPGFAKPAGKAKHCKECGRMK